MQLGAFIITFNRPRKLAESLRVLLDQTRPPDLILVVDNGDSRETQQVVKAVADERVVYHAMGGNLGPAGAAAYAIQCLTAHGCDYIYWGDDDDPPWFSDTLARLLDVAQNADPETFGAAGAVGARFDWRRGESIRLPDEALRGVIEVDTIGGNSQLVLSARAARLVGVPNAALFFGYEEPEYCLRLRKAGFRLLVDGELMWRHRERAGRLQLHKSRALVARQPYDSLWRRYYSTRNYIFMMRRTFARPDLARREAIKAMGRALFAWRRGPRYAAAFTRLQLRGVWDGYREHMGRTVMPRPKKTV